MTEFIDLTHEFRDGMPGFRYKNEAGEGAEFTAEIRPFLTHEESREKYDGRASFEVTVMRFPMLPPVKTRPGSSFPQT